MLVLIAGLGATTAALVARDITGPIVATNHFYKALQQQRWADAYAMTCRHDRSALSPSDFARQWDRNTATLGLITSYDFTSTDTNLNRGYTTVSGTVTFARMAQRNIDERLVKESGHWRICDLPQ